MTKSWRSNRMRFHNNIVYVDTVLFNVNIERRRDDGMRYADCVFVDACSWKSACLQVELEMKRLKQTVVVLGAFKTFPGTWVDIAKIEVPRDTATEKKQARRVDGASKRTRGGAKAHKGARRLG